MSEAFLIWLYLSLGALIENTMVMLIVVITFWFMGYATFYTDGMQNRNTKVETNMKRTSCVILVSILLSSFYPSKDELKWIIGGAVVWNVAEAGVQSEELQALPDNVLGAMNHFLESVQDEE